MSSSDESSFTSGETEKLSGASSPNHSPCLNPRDNGKWEHQANNEIVVDVLTPPREREDDAQITTHTIPAELEEKKPVGRLKFFKDGLLCLELLHHDEGKCTKWTQSKVKTVIPPVVRIVKEAKIPQQSISTLFPIAVSLKPTNSDGGSSSLFCLPVREPRPCRWRKLFVPRRGISSELNFYMKPAPCVHLSSTIAINTGIKIPTRLRRRPYHILSSVTDRPSEGNDTSANSTSKCGCEIEIQRHESHSDADTVPGTRKKSIKLVLDNLLLKTSLRAAEDELKTDSETKTSLLIKTAHTPSKTIRSCREEPKEMQQAGSSVSRKGSRNFDLHLEAPYQSYSKPILNVPGAYRKQKIKSTDSEASKTPLSASSFPPIPIPLPMAFSMVYGNSDPTKSFRQKSTEEDRVERLRKTLRANKLRYGAKPYTAEYPTNSVKSSPASHPHTKTNCKYTGDDGYLDYEKQQLIKQRTISTAISYTINSLLGNGLGQAHGHANMDSNVSNVDKSKKTPTAKISPMVFDNRSPPHNSQVVSSSKKANSQSVSPVSYSGVATEDPTLFLRHLLDTSDPIPANSVPVTPENNPTNLSQTEKRSTSCKKEAKSEKNARSFSPKKASENAGMSGYKNKVVTEKHSMRNSSSPYFGSGGSSSPRLNLPDAISAFHQRYNHRSMCPPMPIAVFGPTSPHGKSFYQNGLNDEKALNLSRREEIAHANGIMDLSLPSKTRASCRDQDSANWNGESGSFDDDVPLNLCKNKRDS